MIAYDVVIPTTGRPSLAALLDALAAAQPAPARVIVVDDRRDPREPLVAGTAPASLDGRIRTVAGGGRGPAAARNAGWRRTSSEWVVFLDDDVLPRPVWARELQADLATSDAGVGAVQGRIEVPLPPDRAPTDHERNVKSLETAVWATADMAYRRAALLEVGGFDERFRRAYREDCELALRVLEAGWSLVRGTRVSIHPVSPASPLVSLKLAAGNADDPLIRALRGRGWRERGDAPRGRRRLHVITSLLGAGALMLALRGRFRLAALPALGWAVLTGDFAWRRISAGSLDGTNVSAMALTSIALPPLCTIYWLGGLVRWLPLRLRLDRERRRSD